MPDINGNNNEQAPRIPVTPQQQPFPVAQPGQLMRASDTIQPLASLAPFIPNCVFGSAEQFDLGQRMARALASSDLVPAQYRDKLANCMIALDIAMQRRVSPLTVMQNMVIIQGRPAWTAQYIIASINACGLFSPLRYEWRGEEGRDTWGCRAYAYDAQTNERLDGSWITIKLAKDEGWYQRTGSKWQTMPEQMLRYRAGAFFGRIYAGHVTMGLPTIEEVADSAPLDPPQPRLLTPSAPPAAAGNGHAPEPAAEQRPEPAPAEAARPPRRRGRPPAEAPTPAPTAAVEPAAAAPAVPTPAEPAAPPQPAPAAESSGLEPAPHRSVIDTDPF
jgi:hypothetical protein